MIGTIDAQDPSQFALAALNGNYTIGFTDRGSNFASQVAGVGAFQTNGAGGIASGQFDSNAGGTVTSTPGASGSLALSGAAGRGTLAFASHTFAFDILDATHLKLIDLGATPATGDMNKQGAGPFSNLSFNNSFAAVLNGFGSGPLGIGALFAPDGSGNVNGPIFDINQNGTLTNNPIGTGAYAVTDTITGRTTLNVTTSGATLHFVFYPEANGALNMLEIDSSAVALGTALPRQFSAFSNQAITGHFALSGTGIDLTTNPGAEDLIGQWLPIGGTSFGGTLDVNDNGTVSIGSAIDSAHSSFSIDSNGRAQGGSISSPAFTSQNVNFYVVDANTVLYLDGNQVITGIMQKQF